MGVVLDFSTYRTRLMQFYLQGMEFVNTCVIVLAKVFELSTHVFRRTGICAKSTFCEVCAVETNGRLYKLFECGTTLARQNSDYIASKASQHDRSKYIISRRICAKHLT